MQYVPVTKKERIPYPARFFFAVAGRRYAMGTEFRDADERLIFAHESLLKNIFQKKQFF